VDTAIEAGAEIPSQYDSLIAKLIVWGQTREEALGRMRRAVEECVVEGIKTTLPLHRRILDDPEFQKGRFSTSFLERFFSAYPS
jgi:acetyl-CoA carboxylase biotin carboxylase subunit